MGSMPSENELTAALMRLCDDPDARARLHIQAAANHGRMVMLDAAYDASGLTATFTEQTTGAPESQRILTTMCADTPAASAAHIVVRMRCDSGAPVVCSVKVAVRPLAS